MCETKKLDGVCPNCGYCPNCGRSRQAAPYVPWYPYPYTYPWWPWSGTTGLPPTTITWGSTGDFPGSGNTATTPIISNVTYSVT